MIIQIIHTNLGVSPQSIVTIFYENVMKSCYFPSGEGTDDFPGAYEYFVEYEFNIYYREASSKIGHWPYNR